MYASTSSVLNILKGRDQEKIQTDFFLDLNLETCTRRVLTFSIIECFVN